MITNAGRLSSTTSQGSPRRFASRDRPMTRPMTVPSSIAIAKAAATRASVVPRLTTSAPLRASFTMASATVCGSGNRRGPASRAPTNQAAMKSPNETSRATTLFSRHRAIERAGRQFMGRTHQLGAADLGEDSIEAAGVGLFLGQRAPHDTFAVARTIDRERSRVARTDARRQPLPFGVGSHEYFLRLARGVQEAIDRRRIAGRPATVERVADDRDRSASAEAAHHVGHQDGPLLATAFEICTEIPISQR